MKLTGMLAESHQPGHPALAEGNDDETSTSTAVVQMMNMHLPALAVKSIKIISAPGNPASGKREHIICAFSDGRILTLSTLNQ